MPCPNPKTPATTASRPGKSGRTAWTAPTRMLTAMNASTGQAGIARWLMALTASATECPTVKARVMRAIRPSAARAPMTSRQRPLRARKAAGSKKISRNSRWSVPSRMWLPPSWTMARKPCQPLPLPRSTVRGGTVMVRFWMAIVPTCVAVPSSDSFPADQSCRTETSAVWVTTWWTMTS